MTQAQLIEQFKDECGRIAETIAAKNANYAGGNGNGAFHNFDMIEHLTSGHLSREKGVIVRMSDKFTRLWSLLDGETDRVGESFADTCRDLAGYALLLGIMQREKAALKRTGECPDCGREVWNEMPCVCEARAASAASDNGGTDLAGVPPRRGVFETVFGGLMGRNGG